MSNLGGHLQKVVAYKSLDHIGLKHRELRYYVVHKSK